MSGVNLILPIAGRSARFPGMRPKFMLTQPNGKFMLTESIRGLDPQSFDSIVIIALQEHEDEYHFKEGLLKELCDEYDLVKDRIKLVLLKDETASQPETVYEGVKQAKVSGGILIKDCDNYFELDLDGKPKHNFVAVVDLHDLDQVNAGNKSYVKIGENKAIVNIVEKKVIGHLFCCGAYYFKEAKEFMSYFEKLKDHKSLYVSHIIYQMILDKHLFFTETAAGYVDWGTKEDWMKYRKQFVTLFIDLDGVLVENSGEHFKPKWGTTPAIEQNVKFLNELYDEGKATIIITTCRTEQFRKVTEEQLKKHNIKYHQLILGLPHTKRFLINDYSTTNAYRSAEAVNLKRNSKELKDMLGSLMK